MVYITSWDDFVERSVQLFRADPDSTRYVMKYRHCDGKLVLKVTDNKEGNRWPASGNYMGEWSLCLTAWDDLLDRVNYFPFPWRLLGRLDSKHDGDFIALSILREDVGMEGRFTADSDLKNGPLIVKVCLKFKTDQAQDAKKMEKLNNLFFTLMSRGPDADVSEVTGKEQTEAQAGKKGRGRKQ
ncbi:hypothetical protein SADUNF_Sadunf05G0163200 [Salix dunnii]|uniref:SRP9 domain-containing protein n=1 Tax=Salix dunnii TaxID=1413687 RepID=A0A835K2B3_9ROSI|nr:hypothetical protein SADUNF_Sadunf05G0163200 [Salix dunnii]